MIKVIISTYFVPDSGPSVFNRASTYGARQSGFEFQFCCVLFKQVAKLLCPNSLIFKVGIIVVLISETGSKK